MRFLINAISLLARLALAGTHPSQTPFFQHAHNGRNVSAALFAELEEFARIVDITYCVGLTSFGISKPFSCLSRCSEFPSFELVKTWNTGPLLSDSCGYIALDHGEGRVIVAFRGTYSVANTIIDLSTVPQKYVPYPGDDGEESADWRAVQEDLDDIDGGMKGEFKAPKCEGCTVHMGFYRAWRLTRKEILRDLLEQLHLHPEYKLHLVGHSLGGAVAALAALDLQARGWEPTITTFGEPRVGNSKLVEYLDERFSLKTKNEDDHDEGEDLRYRRLTHVDDPVPLLPLTEWGFAMHAGEIYVSKPDLTPDITDLEHCEGDTDQQCIAGQDSTTGILALRTQDLLTSIQDEVHDVVDEPWGIPSRYKLWQLFFAHRDYFWRLGVCAPGGDPTDGGGKYDGHAGEEPRVELRR